MSYREAGGVPGHLWTPAMERSSLDRCVRGCGWRRLRMSRVVARVDMTAYIRGSVVFEGGERSDERIWLDDEPACGPDACAGMTTKEWCDKHHENRPSIHVVYDEFSQEEEIAS